MFTIQLARASTTMSSVSISSPCWFINSFTLVGIFEQALSLCFCQVLYLWVELETGRWTGIVFVLQEFLVLTGNRLSVNSEKKWHDKIMLWWRQIMWFSGGPEHCAPKSEVASHSAGADFWSISQSLMGRQRGRRSASEASFPSRKTCKCWGRIESGVLRKLWGRRD